MRVRSGSPVGVATPLQVAALGALLAWAQGVSAQSPPPTFDSAASIVLVDVVVTDKRHRPVVGLTAADFAVSEDGTRREIVSFAAFAPTAPGTAASGSVADAGVHHVQASTALVIDEGHMSPQETARLGPALSHVLRRLTERRGWLLVLAPLSEVDLAGRLPEDATRLAEAAGRIRGRRTPRTSRLPMTDAEAIDIERGDAMAIRRVAARFAALNPEQVSQMDGVRKSLGVDTKFEAMARMQAVQQAAEASVSRGDTFAAIERGLAWLAGQPGRHSLLLLTSGFPHDPADPTFDRVLTASMRANAAIHFLDVASLSAVGTFESVEVGMAMPQEARVSPFEATDAAAGAEQLARSSGGLRVAGDDIAAGLTRLLDTTTTYYILGYEPVGKKRKPGFRRIKVEVQGDRKLQVLARRGYFDEGGAAPASD